MYSHFPGARKTSAFSAGRLFSKSFRVINRPVTRESGALCLTVKSPHTASCSCFEKMENDEGSLQPTDENLKVASAFIRGLSRPDRAGPILLICSEHLGMISARLAPLTFTCTDGKRQEKVLATLRVHRDTYSSVLGTLIQPALQYNMSGLKEHFRIANAYKRRMVSIGPVATADGTARV